MKTIECPNGVAILIAESRDDYPRLHPNGNRSPEIDEIDWSKKEALVMYSRKDADGDTEYFQVAYRPIEGYVVHDYRYDDDADTTVITKDLNAIDWKSLADYRDDEAGDEEDEEVEG